MKNVFRVDTRNFLWMQAKKFLKKYFLWMQAKKKKYFLWMQAKKKYFGCFCFAINVDVNCSMRKSDCSMKGSLLAQRVCLLPFACVLF